MTTDRHSLDAHTGRRGSKKTGNKNSKPTNKHGLLIADALFLVARYAVLALIDMSTSRMDAVFFALLPSRGRCVLCIFYSVVLYTELSEKDLMSMSKDEF